jgi:hypothetical protein
MLEQQNYVSEHSYDEKYAGSAYLRSLFEKLDTTGCFIIAT